MLFVSISCQRIDTRNIKITAQRSKILMENEYKLPFFKSKKNIWKLIHKIKKDLNENGIKDVSTHQLCGEINLVCPDIPYIYY